MFASGMDAEFVPGDPSVGFEPEPVLGDPSVGIESELILEDSSVGLLADFTIEDPAVGFLADFIISVDEDDEDDPERHSEGSSGFHQILGLSHPGEPWMSKW